MRKTANDDENGDEEDSDADAGTDVESRESRQTSLNRP